MPVYRHQLPQLTGDVFLTDGGIETTLIYDDGFDLPDFAAFLLDDAAGHAALQRYFDAYLDVAVRHRVGIVLETPTWRASPDWAARQSYSGERLIEVNQSAVDLLVAPGTAGSGPTRRWSSAAASVPAVTATSPRS